MKIRLHHFRGRYRFRLSSLSFSMSRLDQERRNIFLRIDFFVYKADIISFHLAGFFFRKPVNRLVARIGDLFCVLRKFDFKVRTRHSYSGWRRALYTPPNEGQSLEVIRLVPTPKIDRRALHLEVVDQIFIRSLDAQIVASSKPRTHPAFYVLFGQVGKISRCQDGYQAFSD